MNPFLSSTYFLVARTIVGALFITVFSASAKDDTDKGSAIPLPFILDMVHHNPGESKIKSMFLDPVLLRSWKFNGEVPRVFVQCAVTFESFDKDIMPAGSKEREYAENQAREIDVILKGMKEEGLPCYPFTDFIVLPKRLVEKYKSEICDEKGHIDISRPKTKEILRIMIDEIFHRFPDLGGLTVRHGETYLHDTPYHTGGDPIIDGQDSHVELLTLLTEEICIKRNKMVFYRTWDFGRMHDKLDYYLGVTDRVPVHPKLVMSIKHQLGDFHRLTSFNPCLGKGKHRQIVEAQCQMEAYGKGSYPYYVGHGIIEGWEEYASMPAPRGLKDLVGNPLFAGVWTWSRGGGWKGPYIKNEFWCELNTYVLAHWANNSLRTEEDVFNEFASKIAGIHDVQNLARFRKIALLSASGVLRSQNSLVHKLDVWWNRDEYFGDITKELQNVISSGENARFLSEKADATAMWKEIESLSRELKMTDPSLQEFIRVSSTYGRIKCEIIEQMCWIIVLGLEAQSKGVADPRVPAAIADYDRLWKEWRQLQLAHPQTCASLYTDKAFREKPGMGEAVNRFRKPQAGK